MWCYGLPEKEIKKIKVSLPVILVTFLIGSLISLSFQIDIVFASTTESETECRGTDNIGHASTDNEDAIQLHDKGVDHNILGEYDQALKYFDKALDEDPDYAQALLNKGIALIGLGNYEEALEYFDKALDEDPDYALALFNKGIALGELGNYEEALEYFDKALDKDPNSAQALYNKGVALDHLGNHEEALKQINRALEISPNCNIILNAKLEVQEQINPGDQMSETTPTNQITTETNPATKLQQSPNEQLQSSSFQSTPKSSATTTILQPNFEIYENTIFGITIQYPINSKVTEKNNNIAFTLPQSSSTISSPRSYVIVTVSDLQSPEMSLDQYTQTTHVALGQTRSGFNIVGETEQQDGITLSNNPAHALIFTDNNPQSQNTNQQDQRKTMQIWTVSDNKSYNIAYVASMENFDANLPTVQQMIKSFQITSSNPSESLDTEQQEQQQEPFSEEFDNTNQESQEDGNSGQITTTESDSEQTSSSSFPSSEETNSSFDGSTSSGSSDTSPSQTVSIKGGSLQPSEIEINVGDTVTWTNDDSNIHTITSTDFDSSIMTQDSEFSYTFNTPGEFEYSCNLHPFEKGTVKVS